MSPYYQQSYEPDSMLAGDVSDALWPSLNQNDIPHMF